MTETIRSPKVLLVEDNPSVRNLLEYTLSEEFSVESCCDGGEAVMRLRPGIETIVADVNMPHLGGIDLLTEVERRGLEIPTILITGRPTLESAQEAMAHCAFRYVSKPVQLDELTNLVRLGTRLYQSRHGPETAVANGNTHAFEADRMAQLNYKLDEAIDLLWLALQPIRDTRHNRVLGYEVLLRTALRDLDSPGKIIAVAEECGRMREISQCVRRAAAEALKALAPHAILFLNLHATDMDDPDLLDPRSALSLHADRVVLEVTEQCGWPGPNSMQRKIGRLRAMGYRIALDDLGAGQNGLARLCSLMPDMVKIDRRLVHDIYKSPIQLELVRAIAVICHKSNIAIIAEGVEVEKEYEALRDAKCDLMQGYLFGRPERFLPLAN